MKKQFFRVKQLADQTFLKAEKSESLNYEELQIADNKVEVMRSALGAINKKLCPNGPTTDKEKRLKKCLEYQLGTVFVEESKDDRGMLLQHVLKISGGAEQYLAKEFADHEAKVEELVSTPIQKVVENELPNIQKQKHSLKKYCLDKDSASSRYNVSTSSTKKENLKGDMEEADTKVDQSRDALAIEMFGLLARENEFASYILQLLKLQRGYHESALEHLKNIIPELEKTIGDSNVKKVFGVPLHEHLRVTGKRLALPLEICITALSEFGLSEEGLFRLGGGLSKVKRLKASIDSGCFSELIPEYRDVHVLASTLKLYLRELPEPLLTNHMHTEWMQSMQYPENQRVEVVKHLLKKLPQENRDNLAYLMQFLGRLANHPENKMTPSNIAIVISPNLLWNKEEEVNVNMGHCVTVNMLVELFVKEVNTFFPDEVCGSITITSLIRDLDEPLTRNGNGKMSIELVDATSTESLLDSPKPNSRKKKSAAPIPPSGSVTRSSIESEPIYSNTSATLNKPPKGRDVVPVKTKSTVGINTEENDLSLSRKRSLSKDDIKLLSASSTMIQEATPPNQVSISAQPVKATEEKNFRTTVTHHVAPFGEVTSSQMKKPVAAPRQSLLTEDGFTRSPSTRSTAPTSGDIKAELGDVQLRSKPEIPARPASLAPVKRSSMDIDPTLQKTQCSVYNVANKQQPSIVNIQNRNEKIQLGHDVMMAEKERFLGHSPSPRQSIENKFSDVNSNKEQPRSRPTSMENKPTIPPKSLNLTKSNEKLDTTVKNNRPTPDELSVSSEELNDNRRMPSSRRASQTHSRTRSDGNIKELGQKEFLLHTPSSPRGLSKPTEPPPPPPVAAVPRKPEPESTDF